MVQCANSANAELVIVTRDTDYGAVFEDRAYINDHLKQEFSERVSKKRKLLLYPKLSEALKHFEVPVTQQEVAAETEILSSPPSASSTAKVTSHLSLEKLIKELIGEIPEEPLSGSS